MRLEEPLVFLVDEFGVCFDAGAQPKSEDTNQTQALRQAFFSCSVHLVEQCGDLAVCFCTERAPEIKEQHVWAFRRGKAVPLFPRLNFEALNTDAQQDVGNVEVTVFFGGQHDEESTCFPCGHGFPKIHLQFPTVLSHAKASALPLHS